MTEEKFNFTKAYQEIEKINNWFQEEGIDLDEALQNYEKGMELINKCRERLKQAENKFEDIKKKYSIDTEKNKIAERPIDEKEIPF